MSKAREKWLRGLAGVGVLAVGGFAIVAASVAEPPNSQSLDSETAFTVDVDTSEVLLACPPMLLDPENDAKTLGESSLVSSTASDLQSLAGGGDFVDLGEIRAGAALPEVITAAAVSGSEWNALEVTQCQRPQTRQILLGASTVAGADTLVILANPSTQPVTVDIGGLGTSGELGEASQSISVPAHTTQTWRPAIWFADEDRLAITVRASGVGIAAWLQNSVMDGEVPQGIGSVPGVVPATSLNFPAVVPGATLYIANPGTDAVPVDVSLVEAEGPRPLGGTEDLVVDAGAVFSVNLEGIPNAAINVTSDSPVSAAILQTQQGNAHAVAKDQKIGTRALTAPAPVVSRPWVPPLDELENGLKKAGLSNVEFGLVAVTSDDSGLTYQELDAHEWSGKRLSDGDASYALKISADAKGGPVQANMGLGAYPTELLQQKVILVP